MTKMNNPKFTTPSGDTAPRQVWQQTVDAVLAQTKSQAAGLFRRRRRAPEYLWAERAAGKKGKPGWLRFLAHFNDVLIYVLLARRGADRHHGSLGRYPGDPRRDGD